MRHKSLCFSGHRNKQLPENLDLLKECIKIECIKAIDSGYTNFYQGACYGFDLICAEIILGLKKEYKDIRLISAVPFIEQAKSWTEENKELYKKILSLSDEVVYVSETYKKDCYYKRNRYMVDRSEKLICYCNQKFGGTKYTLNYAIGSNIDCINLACDYNF
ncbi:MAG: SLOG family protein [Clostridia bacterium]